MTIATFAEESEILGYCSPSKLYKLKKEDQLDYSLVEIQGRWHLVMKPVGKPKLKEYLGTILQWKINVVINNHYYKYGVGFFWLLTNQPSIDV